MGAIASGGVRVVNEHLFTAAGISEEILDRVAAREQEELTRREREFRGGRPPLDVRGMTIILVDDGLATGATMRAALEALRAQEPAHLIAGVPIAAPDTCREIRALADEVVCAITPEPFRAVGHWYEDFTQTTDAEVRDLLADAVRFVERPNTATEPDQR